ncbi:hypothetical protein GALL_510800 [mine drainage metagenome]|uniref:Uncharacterized protein n=1 Tax=mine drainage metagenome TaxID=410659 RepID=A0A1J5PUX3_9ZZZZ
MLVDLGEQVLQAVTEFVKQGGDIVVRQQRRFARHARGKVADQVRHRGLQLACVGAQPAPSHVVHPGATTLAVARRRVQVKLTQQYSFTLGLGTFNAIKTHILMP